MNRCNLATLQPRSRQTLLRGLLFVLVIGQSCLVIRTRKQTNQTNIMNMQLILSPAKDGADIKAVTVAMCGGFRLAPGEVAVPAPAGLTLDMIRAAYRALRIPVFVL